jgi:hypothetical protein
MGMTIKSGLPPGYQNQDIKRLFATMQDACNRLETLAQIQAVAGGVGMARLSSKTLECRAALENFLSELQAGAE